MKLHRFTAPSDQKAIFMVNKALGPDALIYSTRSISNGVEILAGLPDMSDEFETEAHSDFKQIYTEEKNKISNDNKLNSSAQHAFFEKMNSQLQTLTDRVEKLTRFMHMQTNDGMYIADDMLSVKRNLLLYHLTKIGFSGKFSQQFINSYLAKTNVSDPINGSMIKQELNNHITLKESELIDEKHVCVLVGPTGIGKTTTILKLAKRYIAKYGTAGIGIITTDYQDISEKKLLQYYKNIMNVDIEFAENHEDLSMIIKSMKNKQLILVDTHGVSQRDTTKLIKLRELIEKQGAQIETYLVLPCNVQEAILDEMARAFKTSNVAGCILTKYDECISIAPALSVAMLQKLKIAYICNGQDINTDIEIPNIDMLLSQLIAEDETLRDGICDNLNINN